MPKSPVARLLPLALLLAGLCGASAGTGGAASASEDGSKVDAAAVLKSDSWLESWASQDYMLGDWGGWRTRLAREYGVNFEFMYFSAVPTNVGGGLSTGSVYEGIFLGSLDLETEKLAGLPGGLLHASMLFIHGPAFSRNFSGDANVASLLDLAGSLRLWELTYEQKLWQDRLSVKFGQMSIDRDFIVPELYNSLASINFLNQTFFYPTMAFNVYDRPFYPVERHALASTPYATPGVRVRLDPVPWFYAQAGVYGGNPDTSYHGTEFNLHEDEGALTYYELGFRPHLIEGSKMLPGSYKIGGFYHTDDFADTDALLATFGLPSSGKIHDGNYGLYALLEQMVYREQAPDDPAQQGLVVFGRTGYSPSDRNFYEWGADGGAVYKGAIPGRDFDTLGVGFSWLSVSNDLIDVQKTINALAPGSFPEADYEAVLEMDYKAQLTAWATLQTSVQRIFHPGARLAQETPDAWVVIVQSSLRF
jgi:porin